MRFNLVILLLPLLVPTAAAPDPWRFPGCSVENPVSKPEKKSDDPLESSSLKATCDDGAGNKVTSHLDLVECWRREKLVFLTRRSVCVIDNFKVFSY
jgi:hypothetical protein